MNTEERHSNHKVEKKCPKCNSKNIIPILYGLPVYEAFLKEQEGKLKLGGCVIDEESPNWHCKDCGYEWKEDPFSRT